MNKVEFLNNLKNQLNQIPNINIDERIEFYSELIDDYMENGLSEHDAILKIGNIEDIVQEIISEVPLTKLAVNKIKPKRKLEVWEIILIILGLPIWFSLFASFISVIFSIYAAIIAVIITIWSIFLSFIVTSFGCLILSILSISINNNNTLMMFFNPMDSLFYLSCSLILAGLSILLYFASLYCSKQVIKISKLFILGLKKIFVKGGLKNEKVN